MDAIHTQIVEPTSSLAARAEEALDKCAFPFPLTSRLCWLRNCGTSDDRLAIAASTSGSFYAALGLTVKKTRAFPGHRNIDVHAIGDGYASDAGDALLRQITRYAVSVGRVLRVRAEVQCRNQAARASVRRSLAGIGYRQITAEQIPSRTLAIDLTPTEDELFSSFSSSTRQKIRKATRHGLQVAPIADPVLGERMNSILAETFSRTGGSHDDVDWWQVLAVCQERPDLSRIVGAFRGDGRNPDDLLAFAWATRHGERVLYDISASTRKGDVRLPLLYPVLWDQIAWARNQHALWFDMNGITGGSQDSEDGLARISSFKRGFGGTELEFGEEWIFEPNRFKSMVARGLSRAVRSAERVWRSRG